MNPLVVVVGTRAEAVKLIPVYLGLREANIPVVLCATYQHSDMLEQVCDVFKVVPDYSLGIMRKNQDLFHITQLVLERTRQVYEQVKPPLVIVHGDTTTTMSSALSAFYLGIPVAHVEAGLRTGTMKWPFPEEMNRKVVGQIATYHFTPTALATANMLSEGAGRENLFCTGNTVVDALSMMRAKILSGEVTLDPDVRLLLDRARTKRKKIVVLTAHRRESFGRGLCSIFEAVGQFAKKYDDVLVFFPQHPNPNVEEAVVASGISDSANVVVTKPLSYIDMVYALMSCDFIATDSGGVQEEGVSLGKRVICLREVTERHEGVWEGMEVLVGTRREAVFDALEMFYRSDGNDVPSSVYGDGRAVGRIVSIIKGQLGYAPEAFAAREKQTVSTV